MSSLADRVARKLTELRESQGLSINLLSERSGVAKGQISQIEAGKVANPGIETMDRLARALGYDGPNIFFAAGVLISKHNAGGNDGGSAAAG